MGYFTVDVGRVGDALLRDGVIDNSENSTFL
jgi:hypothetical protein